MVLVTEGVTRWCQISKLGLVNKTL
jgi:hypothetical protein